VKEVAMGDVSGEMWKVKEDAGKKVALNVDITDALKKEGLLRELIRSINQLRKDAGLSPRDAIVLSYHTDDPMVQSVFVDFSSEIKKSVIAGDVKDAPGGVAVMIGEALVHISLHR
jgi:isoleucyl-tRNA synthetase